MMWDLAPLDVSRMVNAVYRDAKHKFDYDMDPEFVASVPDRGNHLFTFKEAAIVYIGCRIHGMQLMEWMNGRNMQVASLEAPHNASWEEFAALVLSQSYNLRRWRP